MTFYTSITRGDIPSSVSLPGTFVVSGYSTPGDAGVGATYTSAAAVSTSTMAIRSADGVWYRLVVNGELNVGWFGAKGDGVTDDTSSINNAIAACSGGTLLIPPRRYKISGDPAIVVSVPITIFAHNAIFDYGSGTGTAFFMGAGTGSALATYINIYGGKIVRTYSSLLSTLQGVAWKVSNVKGGSWRDINATGFGVGLQVLGDGNGSAYNRFEIGIISDCKVGIQIDTYGALGYSNEHLFIGGRVTTSSSYAGNYAGIKFVEIKNTSGQPPNSIRFYSMTLEGSACERKVVSGGEHVLFDNCRWEEVNPSGVDIEITPTGLCNVFREGFALETNNITNKGSLTQAFSRAGGDWDGSDPSTTDAPFTFRNTHSSANPSIAVKSSAGVSSLYITPTQIQFSDPMVGGAQDAAISHVSSRTLQCVGSWVYAAPVPILSDTAPSANGKNFIVIGSASPITNFRSGNLGQVIYVQAASATKITNNANIKLNHSADFVMAAGDVLVLGQFSLGVWSEISRSTAA